ncbi:hypothetical protein EMIT0P260_30374 [Pseudomonas sp. IT-P260]
MINSRGAQAPASAEASAVREVITQVCFQLRFGSFQFGRMKWQV